MSVPTQAGCSKVSVIKVNGKFQLMIKMIGMEANSSAMITAIPPALFLVRR